jgi:hypothetical protein
VTNNCGQISRTKSEVSPKITFYGRLHVIAYRATHDVPREVVWFLAKLLAAERQRRGTPRGSRALTCFWQAVLGCGGSATAPPLMRWPVNTPPAALADLLLREPFPSGG